ncbi:MAG: hypothetical protein ACXVRV_05860 [Gaiellaceae bacterium]
MRSTQINDAADLAPVFGVLSDPTRRRVASELARTQKTLVALRDAVTARSESKWILTGLSLDTYPSGQASVTGCVEGNGIAFGVELRPRNFFDHREWKPGDKPTVMSHDAWDVDASVSVDSNAGIDSGQDQVMEIAGGRHTDPGAASAALADVAARLLDAALGRTPEPSTWRDSATE